MNVLDLLNHVLFAIGFGCVGVLYGILFLFEFWKKFWVISVGQVLKMEVPKFPSRRERGMKVRIYYRFAEKNRVFLGRETKPLDVPYHQEEDAVKELRQRYPVGGKIAIYHPHKIPELNSITPGGALIPKLILSLSFAALGLATMYLMNEFS